LTINEDEEEDIYSQLKELFKDVVVENIELPEQESEIDKLKRIIVNTNELRVSELGRLMSIGNNKVHALIQELVNKFSLTEKLGYTCSNYISESMDDAEEDVASFIADKLLNKIKNKINGIDFELLNSEDKYRCYIIFKDSVKENEIPSNIFTAKDDESGSLIGYIEFSGKEKRIIDDYINSKIS
jgi:hypothetical protein